VSHSNPISAQQMGDNILAFVSNVCNDTSLLSVDMEKNLTLVEGDVLKGRLPLPAFLYYDFFSWVTLRSGWVHVLWMVFIVLAVGGVTGAKLVLECNVVFHIFFIEI
jgi:hypothetical protein